MSGGKPPPGTPFQNEVKRREAQHQKLDDLLRKHRMTLEQLEHSPASEVTALLRRDDPIVDENHVAAAVIDYVNTKRATTTSPNPSR